MNQRIFILEDDIDFCGAMASLLQEMGFEVESANSLAEAFPAWSAFEPDIALLDLRLPDGDGTELLTEIKTHAPETMVIMLSGTAMIQDAVAAMKLGAEDFFTKPLDPEHLTLVLKRHIERRQQLAKARVFELEIAQNRRLIVGGSEAMNKLLELCRRAAQSNATVLLNGETGTGKQMIAHFIHQNSPRKQAPFVYVNCATFSETLLESNLFGHEKGAFTDAKTQKQGLVEIADGGSLFLDEIGEIPINLQAKLLHYLEYGEFQRVGGTATRKANTRIICATNRDLPAGVQEGRFREDLYYRINVLQMTIPPLKERPEDIDLLLDHFVADFAREMNRGKISLAEGTRHKLLAYNWPGNVRELRNSIERAIVMSDSSTLGDPDFAFLQKPVVADSEDGALFQPRPLADAVNDFKRLFLEKTL
ncbi:MAG: sigma-54-dependent Fis family transcriptional regulator, partial [Calditrichaeota bacterium]|nr:sigma-54-dependent Fis family transcriptional regulator [Calditrichota bacterium]